MKFAKAIIGSVEVFDPNLPSHSDLESFLIATTRFVLVEHKGYKIEGVAVPGWQRQPKIGVYRNPSSGLWRINDLECSHGMGAFGKTRMDAFTMFLNVCEREGEEEYWKYQEEAAAQINKIREELRGE